MCAKMIMTFYDENDSESIFLPCLQLGDVKLAQIIWNKIGNDKEMQNKLLNITDKDKYNCFLLVCKNGKFDSLKWLLSLNDDEKDEAKEDAQRLTQKHTNTGKTCLLLSVANDDRKKSTDKKQKLIDENDKASTAIGYFKCVELIFKKVQNKESLVFETDNDNCDCLQYACKNGNMETATYILSQINEKSKKILIDRKDSSNFNCFHYAIQGGNMALVDKIWKLYKKFQKHKQLINDSKPLGIALKNGYTEITEWLLFSVLTDSKKKVKFLNDHVNSAKTSRTFTETIRGWITQILMKEITVVDDVQEITSLFKWFLTNSSELSGITLILSKIPSDEYTKSMLMKQSSAISYSCENNRTGILRQLLKYLNNFVSPLFESNALIKAIDKGNDRCVDILLRSIKNKEIKDKL
eukprot:147969_1